MSNPNTLPRSLQRASEQAPELVAAAWAATLQTPPAGRTHALATCAISRARTWAWEYGVEFADALARAGADLDDPHSVVAAIDRDDRVRALAQAPVEPRRPAPDWLSADPAPDDRRVEAAVCAVERARLTAAASTEERHAYLRARASLWESLRDFFGRPPKPAEIDAAICGHLGWGGETLVSTHYAGGDYAERLAQFGDAYRARGVAEAEYAKFAIVTGWPSREHSEAASAWLEANDACSHANMRAWELAPYHDMPGAGTYSSPGELACDRDFAVARGEA